MFVENLCSPSILYIAFSLSHILIDTFRANYNTALVKFVLMIVFAILLNILCDRGLSIVAWFLVFIPFIIMTFTTSILLLTFGDSVRDEVLGGPSGTRYQLSHY